MEIFMRYFLTLPFAALALAATPAMAQDAASLPDTATAQTPPTDPMAQPTTTPPADTGTVPPATSTDSADAATTTTPPTATPPTATAGTLTAEQQASYDAWPAATKSYFDALAPARQQLFLRITDNDKAKLVALPASQQETVWASLEKQAAAEPKSS